MKFIYETDDEYEFRERIFENQEKAIAIENILSDLRDVWKYGSFHSVGTFTEGFVSDYEDDDIVDITEAIYEHIHRRIADETN